MYMGQNSNTVLFTVHLMISKFCHFLQLNSLIKVLGLSDCANTVVGDASIRGVSGGEKRRVTLGEMLMPPRSIKYMDAITNGLDSAISHNIIEALKFVTQNFGFTTVISLLQVRQHLLYLFDNNLLN